MNSSVMVALITVSGSIIVAAVSFFLTKWYERKADWQRRKIEHYRELLVSLSGITDGRDDWAEAQKRFADAINTIGLVAPQYVINAVMTFRSYIGTENTKRSTEEIIRLFNQMLLALRKDIGVSRNDNPNTFFCELIGVAPGARTGRKADSSLRSE